jgi:hypothetical protein
MDGKAIAAGPIAAAGLGTLAISFPAARPERIRPEAVLTVPAGPAPARAARP